MPSLNWIGKEKVVNHHQVVPYKVLEHKYGFNEGGQTSGKVDSENMIIHGDNLEALKSLLPKYEGKIKCISIDPPYNLGNEKWTYNDNVNHPQIKKWLGEIVGPEEQDLTRHDKWLCMMYPRLRLLHKLLCENGAIFINIDDEEQSHLRLLCDEIFGRSNFVANIIWEKKYSPQNDAKWLSDSHDFILVYAKNKEIWRPNLLERTAEMDARYKNPDNDPRGPWKAGDMSVKTYSADYDYEITTPGGRVVSPPSGRCWSFGKDRFKKMVEDNRIWFGKKGTNVPSIKQYLSEVQQGTVSKTIWYRKDVGDTQEGTQTFKAIFQNDATFQSPKPPRLIKTILQLATDEDSVILDSFSGSGTLSQAVLEINKEATSNRSFIMIEMEDYANSTTAERAKRVINGYSDVPGTGGAFNFYSLGDPVFDEDGNINSMLPENKIREYIFFMETKKPINEEDISRADHPHYIGRHNKEDIYFYYIKDRITTLDDDFLETIKGKADGYTVYADQCRLNESLMKKLNIAFKMIPRDIAKL